MFARAHRFQLIVDVVALTLVFALLVVTRNAWAGIAGFAVMALHGIVPFRFPRNGVQDERDAGNQQSAARTGLVVCWVALVLATTVISVVRGEGSVPTWVLQYMVWGGWLLQSSVTSATALALDRAV